MTTIVFIDAVSPVAYTTESLHDQTLGGVINSTIRLAEKLGETYRVYVYQKLRTKAVKGKSHVIYAPYDLPLDARSVSCVIVLRNLGMMPFVCTQFPYAKYFVWYHDHPYYSQHFLIYHYHLFRHVKFTLIAVSQAHLNSIKQLFEEHHLNTDNITFDFIYNPIEDALIPDQTKVNPTKLLFCSSVIKGLFYAYFLFDRLISKCPDFQLFVANSSSKNQGKIIDAKNVYQLGRMTYSEVIQQMRESLCLFYPNYAYAETFGLVMAEANAVGTPVLTHDLGAAREVLNDDRQMIDVTQQDLYIQTILEWREGKRPQVTVSEQFRLSHVAFEWEKRFQKLDLA